LIRLHAAGVNPMDKWARDGTYQQFWPPEFPVVLGFDDAGVVEQVGAGVNAFRPGDDVFGQFMPQRVHHWGTYADYVVTSASGAVAPKPISLDYEQAAALPMPAQVALACLDALEIGSGEILLIVGATGGIGTYAIQMAAQRGTRVLATARPEAANYVTSLGAAQALDYTQGDLVSAVHTLYPGGVDAVLDVATRDPAGFEHIGQALRAGGRLLTAIVTAEAPGWPSRASTLPFSPGSRALSCWGALHASSMPDNSRWSSTTSIRSSRPLLPWSRWNMDACAGRLFSRSLEPRLRPDRTDRVERATARRMLADIRSSSSHQKRD
jgi:NADPH:quinone reductase-like Zn-dependent oxidoreductase